MIGILHLSYDSLVDTAIMEKFNVLYCIAVEIIDRFDSFYDLAVLPDGSLLLVSTDFSLHLPVEIELETLAQFLL